MGRISDVAQGKTPANGSQRSFEGSGEIINALDDFDQKIVIDPMEFNEEKHLKGFVERLDLILSTAAMVADARLDYGQNIELSWLQHSKTIKKQHLGLYPVKL